MDHSKTNQPKQFQESTANHVLSKQINRASFQQHRFFSVCLVGCFCVFFLSIDNNEKLT